MLIIQHDTLRRPRLGRPVVSKGPAYLRPDAKRLALRILAEMTDQMNYANLHFLLILLDIG